MAVRGVYTKLEEEMLAEWGKRADLRVGWAGEPLSPKVGRGVVNRVASKELISKLAMASDYRNPLWRDESYARNTRWGGIIAPPFFEETIFFGHGGIVMLKVPESIGVNRPFLVTPFGGRYWEFFKPIYMNDSFKVWIGRGSLDDVTPLDGNSPRKFRIMTEVSYINQRDEVTSIARTISFMVINPPTTEKSTPKKLEFTTEYVYTKEEIDTIDRIFADEEIRGANIRYWEDVNIGDELKPVIWGPITNYDMLVDIASTACAPLPVMQWRKVDPRAPCIIDPVTNIPHVGFEFHLTEHIAQKLGHYSTTLILTVVEHFLGRLITNWMGDDGFMRRFNYIKLANTPLGDTIIGRGKVVKKYIDANDDYLVDLDVWMETERGYIPNVAAVTVSLLSKKKGFNRMSNR